MSKKIKKILAGVFLVIAIVFNAFSPIASPLSPLVETVHAATDIKNDDTLATNLVSYWSLDESSAGAGAVTRVDLHGNNDLTDNNTTPSVAGIISNAADFEATNSEFLSIADGTQSGLDITSSMTINAWVKIESAAGTGTYSFVSKYSSGTSRSYIFDYGDTNTLTYATVNGGVNFCSKAWTPTLGTTYMVSAVFDATADTVKVFVNGTQQGTTCTGQTAVPANGTANFKIGSADDLTRYMDGWIDETGIWSRALSDAEITELYNSGAAVPYEVAAATYTGQPVMLFE